jgi:site-specific DNA-methyltransferase (adenine-specific)
MVSYTVFVTHYERIEQIGNQTLILGDCLNILPSLGAFDLCLTDPPYEIPKGAAFIRKGREVIECGDEIYNAVAGEWLPLVKFSIDAYCLEFGRNHPEAVEALIARHREVGLAPWRFVQIVKKAPPPTPRPHFVSGFEQALVSFMGTKRWYGGGYVIDRWIGATPNQLNQGLVPTQKPLEPIISWMEAISQEEGTVIDPFMGSGTTLVAAEMTGRRGVGIELYPEYFEVACKRVQDTVNSPRLIQRGKPENVLLDFD